MSSRILPVALLGLGFGFAVVGCALQTEDGSPEAVDSQGLELSATPGEPLSGPPTLKKKLEPIQYGATGFDPVDSTEQEDPGKPSPDPWRKPKSGNSEDSPKPVVIDPRLSPKTR